MATGSPYKFVKISEVSVLPYNTMVDVLAWVREVQPVEHMRSRDGRDARKREVLLEDNSAGGSSIYLTLWQAQADNFTQCKEVISLRSSFVREFNGVRSLSGIGGQSSYEMSPSCAGAEELRLWATLPSSLENVSL